MYTTISTVTPFTAANCSITLAPELDSNMLSSSSANAVFKEKMQHFQNKLAYFDTTVCYASIFFM